MKPEDAGRALGVTRKLATHGPTLLITLTQLKRLIRPGASCSAVLAELAKRGILIQSAEGKSTREMMICGLNGSKRRRYVALRLSALMESDSDSRSTGGAVKVKFETPASTTGRCTNRGGRGFHDKACRHWPRVLRLMQSPNSSASCRFCRRLGISGITNFDNDKSCVSEPIITAEAKNHDAHSDRQNSHRYADQAYETARLRRNAVHTNRNLVSAEMLAVLKALGDAMRYVNSHGEIAWKATPRLRDYLMDLQLDAMADLEDI